MKSTDLILYCVAFCPVPLDDETLWAGVCEIGGASAPTKREFDAALRDLGDRLVIELDKNGRYRVMRYSSEEVARMIALFVIAQHQGAVRMAEMVDIATRRKRGQVQ